MKKSLCLLLLLGSNLAVAMNFIDHSKNNLNHAWQVFIERCGKMSKSSFKNVGGNIGRTIGAAAFGATVFGGIRLGTIAAEEVRALNNMCFGALLHLFIQLYGDNKELVNSAGVATREFLLSEFNKKRDWLTIDQLLAANNTF